LSSPATIAGVAPEAADRLGLTGMAGRASAQSCDLRVQFPNIPYQELDVRMATHRNGDVAARVIVRFEEIFDHLKEARGAKSDTEVDAPGLKELVELFKQHFRTHYGVEQAFEAPAGGKSQGKRKTVSIVFEVGRHRTDHRKSMVGVADRQRDRPRRRSRSGRRHRARRGSRSWPASARRSSWAPPGS
jgi:hypothetical protein